MTKPSFLYVIQPFSVFNPRLGRFSIDSDTYIEEENRLASFIESLPLEIFDIPSFMETAISNSPYILSWETTKDGALFTILEPKLSACAATCLVAPSIQMKSDAELLEEIKQALLRSSHDGVKYRITRESFSPEKKIPKVALVDDDIKLIRNVDFLGRAVDIVKLDPINILNTVSEENILDYSFTRETAQLSADGRFGIPPGTKLFPKPSFDVEISTSIFEETTSFTRSFSASVTFSVPDLAATMPLQSPPMVENGQKEICVIQKHLFPSYSPKLVDIVKRYKREAKILINKLAFGMLWRHRAKSQILTEGSVRLDLQGFTESKYNYQIQVGSHTIAAVLIDMDISKIQSKSEQAYAIRKIKSGFQRSLDDYHIYQIERKQTFSFSPKHRSLSSTSHSEDSDLDLSEAAAFSGSLTCEFVKKSTQHAKNTVTCSTAAHSLYTLKEDDSSNPSEKRLDSCFRNWIENKLSANSPDSWSAFIQKFGTHYIASATFGGIGFQVLKLSFEQVEDLHSKKISLETAAANSLLKGSVSSSTESGYSSYSSTSSSHTVFLGGTVLPSVHDERLDFKDWSESVHLEPVPIQVSLQPITNLLVPLHFPNIGAAELSNKRESLRQAIRVYLKEHKVDEQGERTIFTSGIDNPSSWFTLEAAHSPLVVSTPYIASWSTLPYLFPTLRERSSATPIVFYFCVDNNEHTSQKILNQSYCFLGSLPIRQKIFGSEFASFPYLSFYGNAKEAYFDNTYYPTRCGWIVEKLNTTQDQFLRDGDEVRLKHVSSGKYLATTPLKDTHGTLTCTTNCEDAIFIIKKSSGY